MTAAVADFRPARSSDHKIKKVPGEQPPPLELTTNPDILAGLVTGRGGADRPVIVGFAAETGDEHGTVLEHGRAKLARKGCDLLVVNEVGESVTFGQDHNTVHILRRGAEEVVDAGPASKHDIAAAVWDAVQSAL
jgi:phosphopantothenoylcysteine decarboxylase/phosphopantothenate--cysteine ligase